MIYFYFKYNLIRFILFKILLKGRGAEIGVWKGTGSRLLRKNAEMLYLIDPYDAKYIKRLDGKEISQKYLDKLSNKTQKMATKYNNLIFLRMTSNLASKTLSDLDFIYIDGDHWDLYNDLGYWYNKVKKGGIIMGDDYVDCFPEVKRDVQVFCGERNIKLNIFHVQWWFVK